MNKMAEKISAVMNEEEIMQMIADHYLGEAQLLTNGAEENLLKLAELRGNMTTEQQQRWEMIKDNFAKRQMKGNEDAIIGSEIVAHLNNIVTGLQQMNLALNKTEGNDRLANIVKYLKQLNTALSKTEQSDKLSSQLANIDRNMQRIGNVLLAANENTSLNTQLDTISQHMSGLNQSLSHHKNDELISRLGLIAKKLHAIEHSEGLTHSSDKISQQLEQIVSGIHAMHKEVAKASAASVQKAEWLTRRMEKKDA
jgi:hypothetical protein